MIDLSGVHALAVVKDYQQLHAVLRARSEELNITREQTDADCGLPAGYAGKLLATDPARFVGARSLGPLLSLYGLALLVVEDQEALNVFRKKSQKRR